MIENASLVHSKGIYHFTCSSFKHLFPLTFPEGNSPLSNPRGIFLKNFVCSRLNIYLHSPSSRSKFFHNGFPLLLWHVTMHGGHSEVGFPHLVREPVYLAFGVAEDHSLGDSESVIEVAQGVKLPLFSLHSHKELFDTLQGQLVTGE